MANATVVTLGSGSQVSSVSFEDAFGEYSEARGRKIGGGLGKGLGKVAKRFSREERQKRKMQQIADRNERKQARIAGRAANQEMRQSKHDAALEHRSIRKAHRAEERQKRKALKETAPEMDETTATETQDGAYPEANPPADNQQGGGDQGGYDQGGSDQGGDGGSDQGGDDSGSDQGDDQGSDGGEEGYDEQGGGESGDEDSGFDGELDYENGSDFVQTVNVPKPISDLANKIEWNKELVSRLRVKGAEARGAHQDTTDIQNQIQERLTRINELQTAMKQYVSMDGESNASGKMDINKRQSETKKAMNMARKERMSKLSPEQIAAANKAWRAKVSAMKARRKGTPVARGLDPRMSANKIVVPAEETQSGFYGGTGTGIVGLDQAYDYDAPPTRTIEMQSGFDGLSKVNWVGVAIGAVVAVGAVWAIRKYKLI